MVDSVDYILPMTTEVLDREQPAASATSRTPKTTFALDPRVRSLIIRILQTLESPAARQQLQKDAKKQGYSEVELDSALRYLVHMRLVERGANHSASDTVKASPSGSKPSRDAFDPYAAGERLVEQLQQAEGGAWTGQELQSQFSLTPATLHRRRKEYRIIYWRDAQHGFHYPKWQFTPAGALRPGVQEVLAIFRSEDEWRVMRYFLGERAQLDGCRPLDLLRSDEKEKVLIHAQNHAEENTW